MLSWASASRVCRRLSWLGKGSGRPRVVNVHEVAPSPVGSRPRGEPGRHGHPVLGAEVQEDRWGSRPESSPARGISNTDRPPASSVTPLQAAAVQSGVETKGNLAQDGHPVSAAGAADSRTGAPPSDPRKSVHPNWVRSNPKSRVGPRRWFLPDLPRSRVRRNRPERRGGRGPLSNDGVLMAGSWAEAAGGGLAPARRMVFFTQTFPHTRQTGRGLLPEFDPIVETTTGGINLSIGEFFTSMGYASPRDPLDPLSFGLVWTFKNKILDIFPPTGCGFGVHTQRSIFLSFFWEYMMKRGRHDKRTIGLLSAAVLAGGLIPSASSGDFAQEIDADEIVARCAEAMGYGPDLKGLKTLTFRERTVGEDQIRDWQIVRPNLVRKAWDDGVELVFD